MKLSVIIPARNEASAISPTIEALHRSLSTAEISHEILVVDDGSTDQTRETLDALGRAIPTLKAITNMGPHGFGLAVRKGLSAAEGECLAVVMADASDSPDDLVRYVQTMDRRSVDCVFGSRFLPGSHCAGYPVFKLWVNRVANKFVSLLFGFRYNDTTNAFKLYKREAVEGAYPLLSNHFNLTVELPLKAIIRGYSYAVIPISWSGRREGQSKFLLKEMGSRYLFIVLYCFIEKWLSRGDYRRQEVIPSDEPDAALPTERR